MKMKKLIVALLVAALCMVAPVVAFDWGALPTDRLVLIDASQILNDPLQSNSYFDIYIGNDCYSGWCVDIDNLAVINQWYTAQLTSTIGVDEKWNKVNWILNNKGQATTPQIQAAIWLIVAGGMPTGNVVGANWNCPEAQNLADMADPSFEPGCGDIAAVHVNPTCVISQAIIIEVEMPPCPPVPEFPTMMIPVFLVGSLMVAASVLKKE